VASELIRAAVCTGNPHKLDEVEYPPEDGPTFADNARVKARYGRLVGPPERWMLADDSGIEVAALGGGPGVQTARWAEGRHVEKLLAALEGRDDRDARYVCELVAIAPDRREVSGTGVLKGSIALAAAGTEGFGFDPIFVPRGETRTVAELGDAWKAEHSHRAVAARALLGTLSSG
jgi:XTP/dITP diphosphohydrolase